MTAKEFNEKYKNYLEEGYYGLRIDIPESNLNVCDMYLNVAIVETRQVVLDYQE